MKHCGLLIALGILMCVTACANTLYPVTTGSYRSLPKQPARVLVWGLPQAEAEAAVSAWLQKRGLVVITRHKLQHLMHERVLDERAPRQNQRALLQDAYSLGVDMLVVVESFRASAPVQKQPIDSPPDLTNHQSITVVIRGIDVKTGDEEWNARAFYPRGIAEMDGAFTNLACQALATVWGFRPAGYHEISSSDMCHVNPPAQYAPHSTDHKQLGHADAPELTIG